jgi:hypothetical protein
MAGVLPIQKFSVMMYYLEPLAELNKTAAPVTSAVQWTLEKPGFRPAPE